MNCFMVAVSIFPTPGHQVSHAIMPGFIQEGSWIAQGVLRLSTRSLSTRRPSVSPIMITLQGDTCGRSPLTSPWPSRRGARLARSVTAVVPAARGRAP